jgi:hypothetical protein
VTLQSFSKQLLVNFFDNSTQSWTGPREPVIQGIEPAELVSIAAPQLEVLTLYGLTTEGMIHSYTVDRADPFTWTFSGMVQT